MLKRRSFAITLVLVAGFTVFALGGFGIPVEARQSLATDAEGANANSAEIAKQQVALAKTALEVFTKLEGQGRIESGSNNAVCTWSRRLVEATRKSGATQEEVGQAIKSHLARMELRVAIMKAQLQDARGTHAEVLDAQYEVLEARAWLAEAHGE